MKHSVKGLFILPVIAGLLGTTIEAGTVTATRAKLTGRVTVVGGPASSTGDVQQSTKAGGGSFVDTGFDVTTVAGVGTVSIPNVSSGTLLCNYNVRVVFPNNVICGPSKVKYIKKWWANYRPGENNQPVEAELDQHVIGDDGRVHLETWETGANWILRLDPAEASWVTAGINPFLSDTEGDLSANIMSITSQDVVIQISNDPSPLTPNTIVVHGLEINVPPGVPSIQPLIGLQGTSNVFLDGQPIDSLNFPAAQFDLHTAIPAAPQVPALSVYGLLALLLMLLGSGLLFIRRTDRATLRDRG